VHETAAPIPGCSAEVKVEIAEPMGAEIYLFSLPATSFNPRASDRRLHARSEN
jgi:hypothetical protein